MNISSQNNPLIDVRFGIMSYEQFLKDNEVYKFNKICMTEVVNADMMIACFSEEKYYNTSTEILKMGNEAYRQLGLDKVIRVYIHSYKTFMAVANDDISAEDFYNLMKANREQYELIRGQQTGLSGVSRFSIAFGENLVNRCLAAYYLNKDLQNNFILVTDEKDQLQNEQEELLKIFDTLTYALREDKVIPYFQGIHNNKTGEIDKYEALMRVVGENGKVYTPGFFLEASKKLKLYLTLSKVLIDKALTLFEGKEVQLSLNISLHDIQSSDFREWFLDRLKKHPDPTKIIIEFVETEDYSSGNTIYEFLVNIRNIGCLIAIDDFGSGYATYTAITALKPEIIKIDGKIIKSLSNCEDSKIILNSICYMGNLLGSEIVAEFVENEEIQTLISKEKISHSQGYYFSTPSTYSDLGL